MEMSIKSSAGENLNVVPIKLDLSYYSKPHRIDLELWSCSFLSLLFISENA